MTQHRDPMPGMFFPPSAVSDMLDENTRRFWEIQDKLVDCMDAFAKGWFGRRHVGTHAALEAARRMCKEPTPINLVFEYQQWATGAAQRVIADGLDCYGQCMAAFHAFSTPTTPPGDTQQTEPLQSDVRTFAPSKAA